MFVLLLKKDLVCIWREKRVVVGTCGFALALVVASAFSFLRIGVSQEQIIFLTPGIIVSIFLFSGVVGLNSSFLGEQENEALTAVLLTPVRPEWVYLSKFTSNALFLGLVQLLVFFAYSILFNLNLLPFFWPLLLVAALMIGGFCAVATLLSAVSVCAQSREVLFPLLLFPLLLPLLASSVFLIQTVLEQGEVAVSEFWLQFLAGFDLISMVLGLTLFEFVIHE